MDAAAVDISSTALLHNRSPGLPQKGTMRDIVSNYVYPNTLKVIRISGQDIKGALEKSAEYFILDDNGKIKVNPAVEKPKPQHYNYDMWERIEYVFLLSKTAGSRVIKLVYQGNHLKLTNQYDVVMNNYRAGGRRNFNMFKGTPVINGIQMDMTESLAKYIQKYRTIEASCNENWRIIFYKIRKII
jgi:2',3'-cyclic-nucleotide 2'-phosphodiesterase / 3'-nucleotidase